MADFNFGSISQTNNSGVNQVGENHASVNTSGQPSLPADLTSVLRAVREALPAPESVKPAEESPKAVEPAKDETEAPTAPVAYTSGDAEGDWSENRLSDDDEDMFRQLEAIAKMDKEEQEKPENKDRMGKALKALSQYGPAVAEQLAIFGNSALETLADTNPIIGGVYAVCKANLPDEAK